MRAALEQGTVPWNLRITNWGTPVTQLSSVSDQYWSCFYWSVTTLVKVSWIDPRTVYEQAFTALVIMIRIISRSMRRSTRRAGSRG